MVHSSHLASVHALDAVSGRQAALSAIETIFFEASGRTFTAGPERDAFRELWLGRYLDRWPELALVLRARLSMAAGGTEVVAGYLVGCLDDPAASGDFPELGYFPSFAEACRRFPAHLHINLDPRFRGLGLGGLLVERFAEAARRQGAPGMHVVTGAQSRNVGFYAKSGFQEAARTVWRERIVVLLGRPLA